ncbi:MAG TPA: hypothetical protein VFW66_01570 [Gemmatimonadales bacterium]|nr:hypothetical protein [Gemmatimonadales bacterium]
MSTIALVVVLVVVLMIPILGILIDSPLARALARRLEGPESTPAAMTQLARKVELLEAEVDDLTRSVRTLEEEHQFLQRLLAESPRRSTLPPPETS